MKTNYIFFNRRYLFKICFILCIIFFYVLKAQRTLTVRGNNWTVSIPSITEAGSNYTGIYESDASQILLTAVVPALLGTSKVSVHYEPNPT